MVTLITGMPLWGTGLSQTLLAGWLLGGHLLRPPDITGQCSLLSVSLSSWDALQGASHVVILRHSYFSNTNLIKRVVSSWWSQ